MNEFTKNRLMNAMSEVERVMIDYDRYYEWRYQKGQKFIAGTAAFGALTAWMIINYKVFLMYFGSLGAIITIPSFIYFLATFIYNERKYLQSKQEFENASKPISEEGYHFIPECKSFIGGPTLIHLKTKKRIDISLIKQVDLNNKK